MTDRKVDELPDGGALQDDDQLYANRGGTDVHIRGSAVGGSGGLPLQLPIQDGRYYFGLGGTGVMGGTFTTDMMADTLVASPFVSATAKTWNRIGFYGAVNDPGIMARLGIYEAGADGLPDALLLDAGEIEIPTDVFQEITISQALDANTIYWLAICAESSAVAEIGRSEHDRGDMGRLYGYGALGLGEEAYRVHGSHVYGALPASFGAATIAVASAPYIWLRTGV